MKSKLFGNALAVAALATSALTFLAPEPAHAQFGAMAVIDVKAIAQMAKQVQQATQQLATLKQQLTNQQRMLSTIGSDISPELSSIISDANSILRSANGIGYNAKDLTGKIDQVYAGDLGKATWNQLANKQADWEARTRATRREAMEAQSAVAQSQSRTQNAVSSAVAASQKAQGQTAAVQATNQLLAALSSQLQGLQTLLITQQRAVETANEQRAAQRAAADAKHKKMFGDYNALPSYGTGY